MLSSTSNFLWKSFNRCVVPSYQAVSAAASFQGPSRMTNLLPRCCSTNINNDNSTNQQSPKHKQFYTPSPYKPADRPTRYGYRPKLFDGGLLPRIDEEINSLPKYKPGDAWSGKKALFGQNDYIDILGDGSIKPYETIEAPFWLRGFRGHEFARTLRRLKFTGMRLKSAYPSQYRDLNKRMKYLFKQFNMKRKSHRSKPKYM